MVKLQMCRICLAENVRMYVVVNKTLHDLYEKLTDHPFVSEDSRPILACFICCAQLKKCYRFQKKCQEAVEQFAKMMNEDYEGKSLMNQDQFECFHGFIKTPIKSVSIVDDVDQTELPAICERHDDIIQPKEEHESDNDLNTVNIYDNYMDIEDTPQHQSESYSENYVPLMEVKTEVKEEQEASKMEQETNSTLMKYTFSRMHFFEIWSAVTGSITQKHQHVLGTILASLVEVSNLDIRNLDHKVLNLCKSLDKFWKKVSRNKSRILHKYSDWLNEIECIELVRSNEQCIQENANQPGPSCERGRPTKDFSELSKRSKRRRLSE